MSILLAYYRLYGTFVNQYEPVMTKYFYHGRTEAMRTTTPEATEFCKVWCSQLSTNSEKLDALMKATKEHSRLVKECAKARGVDRHLFALKCIAEQSGEPLPPFFQSRPWKTLNHTILSTSNCGNPSLRLFGFGPVVPDGFGVGYIIRDNGLQFSVSSKHRQTNRYVHSLRQTLIELKKLLNPISKMEVRGHHRTTLAAIKKQALESDGYDDFFGEGHEMADVVPALKTEARPPLQKLDSFSQYFRPVVRRDSITRQELSYHGVPLEFLASGSKTKE